MVTTATLGAETSKVLVESILIQAALIGPDSVAELLAESIGAEFDARECRGVHADEIRTLQALATEIREGIPAIPLPGFVVEGIIAAVQADQPALDAATPKLLGRMVVERCRAAVVALCDQRRSAATLAARTIGPNRTISVFGVGDRHKELATALASQYGHRARVLVCEPERGYKDHRENVVHELTSHLRSVKPDTELPTFEVVRLGDAALAVSQSDFLFILACGIQLSGELIVPPGAESVYHSALAFGKDIGVIAGIGDIVHRHAVPMDATAYTILSASPSVRVFSPDRKHDISSFIETAHGADVLDKPVLSPIAQEQLNR